MQIGGDNVNSTMHKSLAWLFILLCVYNDSVVAQNAQTDSLARLLETAKEDTNKVHLYWKAGASVIYQDAKAAIIYFKKGAALATRLHFVPGMERCHNATSLAFQSMQNMIPRWFISTSPFHMPSRQVM
jgi:hypothetical protein